MNHPRDLVRTSLPRSHARPAADAAHADAAEAFLLPTTGLFVDLEAGAGTISPEDDFRQAPAQTQLRVLASWQGALDQLREQAFIRLFNEHYPAGATDLSLPQRLAAFAQTCESMGLSCPRHMATLLQKHPY